MTIHPSLRRVPPCAMATGSGFGPASFIRRAAVENTALNTSRGVSRVVPRQPLTVRSVA